MVRGGPFLFILSDGAESATSCEVLLTSTSFSIGSLFRQRKLSGVDISHSELEPLVCLQCFSLGVWPPIRSRVLNGD
jgi:hypothetical protein